MPRSLRRLSARVGWALALACFASSARADAPEPGTWRAGATSTEVSLGSWGADCGAPPRSTRSAGGGTVLLRREGRTVLLEAGGRVVRSDACWSQNPAIKRVASTERGGVWTTTCVTQPSDPREEHGSYTLELLPDGRLLYKDVSRYDWRLQQSTCAATATTTQTLARIDVAAVASAPAPAAPAPPAVAAPVPPAVAALAPPCTPGAAARIALRPQRANIELGQRVCFQPVVSDASGCAVPAPAIRWSVEHDPAIKARMEDGCFVAGDQAAEAEGEFRVIAAVGSLRADAPVSVRTPDLSSVLARRIETGALQGDVPTAPVATTAPPKRAAKVAAQPTPPAVAGDGRAMRSIAMWGGLAGALGLLGWFALSRRKAGSAAVTEAIRASERPPPPAPVLPTGPMSGAPGEAWICPTCRVGYPRMAGHCPKDGTALMPYRQFAETRKSVRPAASKRCPRCGKLYAETAAFCSEDGSPLA